MRQEWSPQPPECENCNKTGPPVFRNFHANPGCVKTAAGLVHQCCCNFRTCENCDKTGPPVLLQFSRKMDHCCCSFRTWGGQCCCIFRTCEKCNNTGPPHVRKLQQQWSILRENCDNTGPNVRKMQQQRFDLCENCVNTGPPCAKSATTLGAKCAKSVSGFKYYRYIWFRV